MRRAYPRRESARCETSYGIHPEKRHAVQAHDAPAHAVVHDGHGDRRYAVPNSRRRPAPGRKEEGEIASIECPQGMNQVTSPRVAHKPSAFAKARTPGRKRRISRL